MSVISKELSNIQELIEEGDFMEALTIIEKVDEVSDLNDEEKFSYYLLKGTILFNLSQFEQSYEVANQAYQESIKIKDELYLVDILTLIARNLIRLNRFDEAIKTLEQAEELAINYQQGASNEIDLKRKKATLYSVKGYAFFYKGDSENSLSNIEDSLSLFNEIDDKKGIMYSFMQLGYNYFIYKGEWEKSLYYSERAEELGREIGIQKCKRAFAMNSVNIGNVYISKGELDRALPYYEHSSEILRELNDDMYLNATLSNLANISWLKGELNDAFEHYKKLNLNPKLASNPWLLSINLINLIELSIDKEDLESANFYHNKLQELNEQIDNPFINNLYRYSKGIILRTSARIRDQAEAQEIFKEIIKDKISSEITIEALIKMCDLLLIELRSSNNLDILKELNSYILNLLEFAKAQNSFSILGETYLLQARLALIDFNFSEARQLFSKAQSLAEKYGIKFLAMKISAEHDELLKDLELWETLKEKNASVLERLRLAHLTKDMDILVKNRAIIPPKLKIEQPILLLVLSKSGKIVLSQAFIEEISIDNTYIGRFLTFFNTFSNQIFSESFDRVKFGQYTVLFTTINSLFIIYIFQGQTYGARQKLIHFTETIKKESQIKSDLESYYKMGKVLSLSNNPLLEELINNSFMVDAQKLEVPFKAYKGDKHFVFVSYTHADKLQVYPIIDFLNSNGIRIWYDEGIPISVDWKKSIVDNLERCRVFLVFISPHIVNSEMVRKEISYALKKKKQFFAVYLKETMLPSELEFEIADIQALMRYKLSDSEFYNKLKNILEPIISE
ncbi:MAG: tetratricopeptide repeat protein [Candidatus Thorarchaeota archaeon]